MNRPRIVVEVNGGVVQAVYSDDPQTTIALSIGIRRIPIPPNPT